MENAYAEALLRMVKKGEQPKKAVHAVVGLLTRDRRLALLPRVGRALQRMAAREARQNSIVLTVAREKDERHAKTEAQRILKELGAEGAEIHVKTDDSLIGGWRFEGRGHLVDASYRKALLDVYNRATKTI